MLNNSTTSDIKEEGSFWGTLFLPFTFPSKFQKFSQAFDAKVANLKDAQKKTREEMHRATHESIEDLQRYAAKAPELRH